MGMANKEGSITAKSVECQCFSVQQKIGPFELPTCDLLQRGWDHTPPKALLSELCCIILILLHHRSSDINPGMHKTFSEKDLAEAKPVVML